jgi:methylated-DNA-[protein]-cysteine S-methyltransferase
MSESVALVDPGHGEDVSVDLRDCIGAIMKSHSTPLAQSTYASPVGDLTIVVSERGLAAILWPVERPGRVVLDQIGTANQRHQQLISETAEQLSGYFGGERQRFSVELDPAGTDFQRLVWARLSTIEFGTTATYGEIATALGRPTASRAVGAATGRNPVSIIVPCHRVLGSSGAMTGFAGGIETKQALLRLEGHPGLLFG